MEIPRRRLEDNKLLEAVKDKYDLIGLCGCDKISVSQSPLNWFCGSRPFPMNRWGCVTHGELGDQITYFSQHSPEILDHEVACIDGLCIVFTKKAVEAGLRFDENLAPFELKHYSVGRSITTDQFLINEIAFRDKWHLDYPQNSRIAMIKMMQINQSIDMNPKKFPMISTSL